MTASTTKPKWITPQQIIDLVQEIQEQTRASELSASQSNTHDATQVGSANTTTTTLPNAQTLPPGDIIPIMRSSLKHIPPLPSILIYPSSTPSSHKKDFLKYKKKNHNRTIKESYRRISVDKKPRIACYYAKAENDKIERRCFKDLQNDRFVLVQYCITDNSVIDDLRRAGRWIEDSENNLVQFDVTRFLKGKKGQIPESSAARTTTAAAATAPASAPLAPQQVKQPARATTITALKKSTTNKTGRRKKKASTTPSTQNSRPPAMNRHPAPSPTQLHPLGQQNRLNTPTRVAALRINTSAQHPFTMLASPQGATTPNSTTQLYSANGMPLSAAFPSPHTPSGTQAPSPLRVLPHGVTIIGAPPMMMQMHPQQRAAYMAAAAHNSQSPVGTMNALYTFPPQQRTEQHVSSPMPPQAQQQNVAASPAHPTNFTTVTSTPRTLSNSVSPDSDTTNRKRKRTISAENPAHKKTAKRRLSITTPFSNVQQVQEDANHFDMLDIDGLMSSPLSTLDEDMFGGSSNSGSDTTTENAPQTALEDRASSGSTQTPPPVSSSVMCAPPVTVNTPGSNPNSVNSPVVRNTQSSHNYASNSLSSQPHNHDSLLPTDANHWRGCEINFQFLQQQQHELLQKHLAQQQQQPCVPTASMMQHSTVLPRSTSAEHHHSPFSSYEGTSFQHNSSTVDAAPFSDTNPPMHHSTNDEHHDNVFESGSNRLVSPLYAVNSTTTPTQPCSEAIAFPPPPVPGDKSTMDHLSELEVKVPMEDDQHGAPGPQSPLSCTDDSFSLTFSESPFRDSSSFFEALEFEKVESFRIIDFSPAALELGGGSTQKVIIVVENKGDFHYNPELVYNFECVFGPYNVPAEPLTSNNTAFRCFIPKLPPSMVGTVDMYLQLGSTRVSNTVKFQFNGPQIEGLVNERLAEAQLHERIIRRMNQLADTLHLPHYSAKASPHPNTLSLEEYASDIIQKCYHHCTSLMYTTLFSTDEDGLNMIHYASGLGWIDTVSVLMNLRQRYEKYAQLKATKDKFAALLIIQKHMRSWIDRRKVV